MTWRSASFVRTRRRDRGRARSRTRQTDRCRAERQGRFLLRQRSRRGARRSVPSPHRKTGRLTRAHAGSLSIRPDHGRDRSVPFLRRSSTGVCTTNSARTCGNRRRSRSLLRRLGAERARVSVVGDFNGWDGRVHPMRKLFGRRLGTFYPRASSEDAHYKFEIRTRTGRSCSRAIRSPFSSSMAPTSSLVYNLDRYQWSDAEWMEARQQRRGRKARSAFTRCISARGAATEEGNRHLSYLELATRSSPTWSTWATRTSS